MTTVAPWIGAVVLLLAAIVGAVRCTKGDDASSSAARATPGQTPRIVSLSPAITRTLVDVGLGDAIVGRTQYCTSVPQSIPVVGSLLDIDAERLIATRPTHVLVQPAAAGMNPELTRLTQERGWTLGVWRLDRLGDVATMLRGLGETLRGAPFDHEQLAKRTAMIEQFVARTPPADAPRVLLLASTSPMGAAGTSTYLDELLHGIGARNALSKSGYPEVSHEDLARMEVDAIVVLREKAPSDAERARLHDDVLSDDALRRRFDNRFVIVVDPDVMMPSSASVDVAKRLNDALKPIFKRGAP